jgi:hypothetical protein
MSEVCENCGAPIGNLEPAMVWDEHIVCRSCYERLATHVDAISEADVIAETSVVVPPNYYAPPPTDPLQQLAAAQQSSPPNHQAYYQQNVHIHVPAAPPRYVKKSRPLLTAGLVIMLASIPFCCIMPPVGILLFAAGFVLMIVGAFQ